MDVFPGDLITYDPLSSDPALVVFVLHEKSAMKKIRGFQSSYGRDLALFGLLFSDGHMINQHWSDPMSVTYRFDPC